MLGTPFPFFISKKTRWNSDISNWYSEDINFGLYISLNINIYFRAGHVLLRHCDVIRWPIFMILGINGKRRPYPNNYTLGMSISSLQGGSNHPQEDMLHKGSGRWGLTLVLLYYFSLKLFTKGCGTTSCELENWTPPCLIDGFSHNTKISTNIHCMTSQWHHKG